MFILKHNFDNNMKSNNQKRMYVLENYFNGFHEMVRVWIRTVAKIK